MPEETLRIWLLGRRYPAGGALKRSEPVIDLDDPTGQYLSFVNLVEAHVLAAIRRKHGVKLPKVWTALDYVKKRFRVERPLIEQNFQTDGLDLFVERYGELVNASRDGQQAMKEIFGVYLARIERDAGGLPIRLYPFTRERGESMANPKVVVMSPTVSFGRPVIAGTGIPVASIYERYKAGDSMVVS
jgi:hypothetical protein